MPILAHAQYTSPSYNVEEIFIGGGSQFGACSTGQFCADQSVGGTAVGNTNSSNFRSQSGALTASEPVLEVNVTNNIIDLGVLSALGTAADSFNFSVKNYLSEGYFVKIYGNSPTNSSGGYALTALNSPNTSAPGSEQFGLNLVGNSNPGIGADPVQVPDSSFSFGNASTGYDTDDFFKYASGDTVAESAENSGETQYTVSVIANVATSTPGGQYSTTLVLQVIPTF
jgi:hypothetical protein